MSELVTSAFSSISMKSIFTRALVRSQGIVTLSIHITTVCSIQTLIYVCENKIPSVYESYFDIVWYLGLLLTCAVGSISLISIFTSAFVGYQGIVTLSIYITVVFSFSAIVGI